MEITNKIFPASAGVFLSPWRLQEARRDIPRIRGGVSIQILQVVEVLGYSPHPRGCFCYS